MKKKFVPKVTSFQLSLRINCLEKLQPFNKITYSLVSARLAQSVEHETLNLRVVGSSPTLGDFFKLETLTLLNPYHLKP